MKKSARAAAAAFVAAWVSLAVAPAAKAAPIQGFLAISAGVTANTGDILTATSFDFRSFDTPDTHVVTTLMTGVFADVKPLVRIPSSSLVPGIAGTDISLSLPGGLSFVGETVIADAGSAATTRRQREITIAGTLTGGSGFDSTPGYYRAILSQPLSGGTITYTGLVGDVIPEPASLAAAVAGVVMMWRRRRFA